MRLTHSVLAVLEEIRELGDELSHISPAHPFGSIHFLITPLEREPQWETGAAEKCHDLAALFEVEDLHGCGVL